MDIFWILDPDPHNRILNIKLKYLPQFFRLAKFKLATLKQRWVTISKY